MTAFFVARAEIKDPAKFQEYGQKAGPTLQHYGGEFVARGKLAVVLTEGSAPPVTAVARFKDTETAKAWYQSAEYQALIPLRDEAADITIAVYEDPTA